VISLLPVAGVHYPGNLAAERSWFPNDVACLDFLHWPSAPEERLARAADADAGIDKGPELTPRRDAPTGSAKVARMPCTRLT
jgi:hypothetical protein